MWALSFSSDFSILEMESPSNTICKLGEASLIFLMTCAIFFCLLSSS